MIRFEHLDAEQLARIRAAADQAAADLRMSYLDANGCLPSADVVEAFGLGFYTGTAGATNDLIGALQRLEEYERSAVARAFAAAAEQP